MPKVIFALFLSCFFSLFILPQSIQAATFTVVHDPPQVLQSSGKVRITIISQDTDFFVPEGFYSYSAKHTDKNKSACSKTPTTPQEHQTKDSRTYTAEWEIKGCLAEVGEWEIQFYQDASRLEERKAERNIPLFTSKGSAVPLLSTPYKFTIEQAGGQLPNIFPLQSPLRIGSPPFIVLQNARANNKYQFWWQKATRSFAAKIKPDRDGNIIIPLAQKETDFSFPGIKQLCMEIGDDLTPTGVTCKYTADFKFTQEPVSSDPSCQIFPPQPTNTDNISLIALNLPKNKITIGDLATTEEVKFFQRGTVDSNGIFHVNANIALPKDNYTGHVYNEEGQSICEVKFTVGDKADRAKKAIENCDPQKQNCTSAAGISCLTTTGAKVDPKNLPNPPPKPEEVGIMTAIGCVPTEPTELIKGLLKVAVGAGGGVAFLLMIAGAFQMITSAGNPDGVKKGSDQMTNAVIGLLFIIFSVFLFKVIGVDILNIGALAGVIK